MDWFRRDRRFRPMGRTTFLRPNRWTPDTVERRIHGAREKWVVLFDRDGRQVVRARGTPFDVQYPGELSSIDPSTNRPLMAGFQVIHNHPTTPGPAGARSFPPSDSDVLSQARHQMGDYVTVSVAYRYLIRPVAGHGWDDVSLLVERILRVRKELDATHGVVTDESADHDQADRQHLVLRALDGDWLDYVREDWHGGWAAGRLRRRGEP